MMAAMKSLSTGSKKKLQEQTNGMFSLNSPTTIKGIMGGGLVCLSCDLM
jgi:hypothetical protein